MPNEPDVFQERLRLARQMREWQQADLAARAGLPAASISHFESGTRKPSFDNLRRLASALEVSTDYLLGRVANPGMGGGDQLNRHVENLTGADRELAEQMLKLLAERNRKGGTSEG